MSLKTIYVQGSNTPRKIYFYRVFRLIVDKYCDLKSWTLLATCFYLAKLNEVFLDTAKNTIYYLCLEILLLFFVWQLSLKNKDIKGSFIGANFFCSLDILFLKAWWSFHYIKYFVPLLLIIKHTKRTQRSGRQRSLNAYFKDTQSSN